LFNNSIDVVRPHNNRCNSFTEMTSLEHYGWDFHRQNFHIQNNNEQHIGRVISIRGFKYLLITTRGELETELAGRLLYGADPENIPKVGDWVAYLDYGEAGYIIDLLPRTNFLSRRNPGNRTEKQLLAANIDFAFIVQGLDRDFNLMRLERYLSQVTACGIEPVVILNKADLVDDVASFKEQVIKLQRDCNIFFTSTVTLMGIDALKQSLGKYKTYMLIGSSGAGKSSLLNILMQGDVQRTASIGANTNKGRHTTTTRDLFQLPGGSLMIDTPGMREFGFTDEESSTGAFPVIDEFATQCHFNDCRHINEAGCAVLDALQTGKLDAVSYESYLKLMKERRRFEIDINDRKRKQKQFGRMTKEAKNHRKKYKY
jgi:ribosome biogenesis GTPase / thiamine phosphate phosphatase